MSRSETPSLLSPRPPDLSLLDFDGVQRYSLLSRLLDRMLWGVPRPVRILEVGSNALDVLAQFLDAAQMRVVRCDVVPCSDDPDFVLTEKDKPLPFGAGSFDAVFSLEVLEHIPAEGRRRFLTECVRVARHGAVFSCPNGVPEVATYEALANEAYRQRNSYRNPWLDEHQECGLPPEEQIVGILEELGYPHAVFKNSPLETWLPLLVFTQVIGERCSWPAPLHGRLNQAFFPGVHDNGPLPYRKMYVCAKSAAARQAVEPLPEMHALAGTEATLPRPLAHLHTLANAAADVMSGLHQENLALEETLQRERAVLLDSRQEAYVGQGLANVLLSSRRRGKCQFGAEDLVAWHQLQKVPSGPGGAWLSAGPDARFIAVGPLPPGWFRVRHKLRSSVPGVATLYVDVGNGFFPIVQHRPEETMAGIDSEEFFKFTSPVRAVRLDPLGVAGRFQLDEFCIEALSPMQVLARTVRSHVKNFPSRGGWVRAMAGDLLTLFRGRIGAFKQRLRREFAPPVERIETVPITPEHEPLAQLPGYEDWCLGRAAVSRGSGPPWPENRALVQAPLISILLPIGDGDPDVRPALDSVLGQAYQRWELCIAVSGRTGPAARALLRDYAARDHRVRVAWGNENTQETCTWNAALDLASGSFVALLSPEDELAEGALPRLARALTDEPDLDLVYSDEDRLTADGRRTEPLFKPDWSPEYLLGSFYMGRLTAYRTLIVREVGGFRDQFAAAHEYDLALRVTARTARVGHIAEVLYHARRAAAELQSAVDSAARRAIEHHLVAAGRPGRVAPGVPGTWRVRFALAGRPRVSIIIPSSCRLRATNSYLSSCLSSIVRVTTYDNYEIMVIGHSEIPPAVALEVASRGGTHIPYDGALNIAAKMNLGAATARGDYLLFLNDDTEVVTPDWIESLLEFAQQPDIGAVGAKLLYPEGLIQHAGVVLTAEKGVHWHGRFPATHPGYANSCVVHRNCLAVTGACVMSRADAFHAVGGFTEQLPLDFNDIDYCLKLIDAGQRVVFQPHAQLLHHEAVSKPRVTLDSRSGQLFRARWSARWPRDPYFNYNLEFTYRGPRAAIDVGLRDEEALAPRKVA
jgi:GT2 family glycosyltransferase